MNRLFLSRFIFRYNSQASALAPKIAASASLSAENNTFTLPFQIVSRFFSIFSTTGFRIKSPDLANPPVFRNGTPYDKLTILYSSACSSSILIRFDFVCLDCGSMYVI